jgi:hypothetical protein
MSDRERIPHKCLHWHSGMVTCDKNECPFCRLAESGNYVCDDAVNPTVVTFANGRRVSLVNGRLDIGWKHE